MVDLQVVTQRVIIRHFEVIGSGGQRWAGGCFPERLPLKFQALRREQMEFMLKFLLAFLIQKPTTPTLCPEGPKNRNFPQRFDTSCRTLPQVWALIPRRPSW